MILFVDDDICYLRVINHMLKFQDVKLVTQNKVPEAIDWLKNNSQCKLIIVDLHMRDGQGIQILKWLEDQQSSIPILILEDPNRDNFNDHLIKHQKPILKVPFNGEALQQSIRAHYNGELN